MNDDIPALLESEFGDNAELAEWNDLKDLFSDDESALISFLDGIGMKRDVEGYENSAFVTRGGDRYHSTSMPRHYFVSRHDGDVPSGWLVHDDLHSNRLSLGSWDSDREAMVRVPESEEDPPGESIYTEDFSSDPGYTIAKSSTDNASEFEWDEEQENYFVKTVDGSGSGEWWVFSGTPLFSEIRDDDSFTVSFKFNPVHPDWGSYPGLRFIEDDNEEIEGSEVETEWAFRLDCRDSSGCSSSTEDTHSRFRLDLGGGDHFHSPRISDLDAWYEVTINYDGSQGAAEIEILKEDGSVFAEESGLALMASDSSFSRILLGRRSSGPPEYGDTSIIRVDDILITGE